MNYLEAFGDDGGGLEAFDRTEAAPEFAPVPPGTYIAKLVKGEFTTTKAGADAYRVRWELEGEHAGRSVIRTWTFSAKALPYTKRDLAPLGLDTRAKLLSPFPPPGKTIVCKLTVALQRGDDGTERNDVKKIEVLRVDDSPAAAFMVPEERGEGGNAAPPPSGKLFSDHDPNGAIRR